MYAISSCNARNITQLMTDNAYTQRRIISSSFIGLQKQFVQGHNIIIFHIQITSINHCLWHPLVPIIFSEET